jgi:4-hydroxy-3-methylbut-2-enyl diphosphate reductase IspH
MITHADQLDSLDLSETETIGICGATSTPMWLMQEIAAQCAK